MSRTLTRFCWILCLLLAACSPAAVVPPTSTPTLPPTATRPADTATPLPPTATPQPTQPSATPLPPTATPVPKPVASYHLTVAFDFGQKAANVEEQIDYTNTSRDTLADLRLMVPPMVYKGSFTLKALNWGDGQVVQDPTILDNGIQIALTTALVPGASTMLKLSYHLALPSAASVTSSRPVPFGYTSRQANLVDWYPLVAPYVSGAGWLAHKNGYYGETLVYEMSQFDVKLSLSGSTKELTVAASAPAVKDGNTYTYQLDKARNFALSISDQYASTTLNAGAVQVTSYYFTNHAPGGKAAAQVAANAVGLFSGLFAPYPHATLAVVEADFQDGMEFDGLIFVGKGMVNLYSGKPTDYLTAITAHETAHQWWYALVGNDQALEPWLDEAMATYCEELYYEKYHPDAVKWWWEIRINYYHPQGWINNTVYSQEGHTDSYNEYRNAVYFNGAVFFSELRKATGDADFMAFLKDYANSYTGKIATRNDFFTVLARHTKVDISPILKRFFSS